MKHPILAAIAILLFFSQFLQAQDSYEDVVYLRNGSVVRGLIVEIVPGKSITIESLNHFSYTITYEQIERIRKELKQSNSFVPSSDDVSASHYFTILQAGMLTNREVPLSTFNIVRSGNVSDYLSVGLGVGWDTYGNGATLPLYVDARGYLFSGQASPFVFTDAGYSLGSFKHRKVWDAGGFVMNAGAGFVVRSSSTLSYIMQVSYHLQRLGLLDSGTNYVYGTSTYQAIPYSNRYIVTREFVAITVGIGF